MAYNTKHFRIVRHGLEEESCYCRMCNKTFKNAKEAYAHAKKTLHTVDVYRENWTEYTSYIPTS